MRRFNRTVTQRVGALSDDFLSRSRPLADVAAAVGDRHRGRRGGDAARAAGRGLRADEPDAPRARGGRARDGRRRASPTGGCGSRALTEQGLAERAILDERSDELAASILEPLERRGSGPSWSAAMRDVERLIAASLVEIRRVDPEEPDAQRCLRAYVAELNRRAPDRGFDPSKGSTAEAARGAAAGGAFVVAYLRGEPVGCGAVKHHPGEVDATSSGCGSPSRRAGSASAAGCSSTSRACARERGASEVALETGDVLRRGDRALPLGGLRRGGRRSTTSRSRTTGSRSRCAEPTRLVRFV